MTENEGARNQVQAVSSELISPKSLKLRGVTGIVCAIPVNRQNSGLRIARVQLSALIDLSGCSPGSNSFHRRFVARGSTPLPGSGTSLLG